MLMDCDKILFCRADGEEKFFSLVNQAYEQLAGNGPRHLHTLTDPYGGFHQGGKWKGVWTQNSLGMYASGIMLSGKLRETYFNTLKLFFKHQGDGVYTDRAGMTAPPGALPEYVALPPDGSQVVHFKNDESSGLAAEFDFWVEGTATTVIMMSDLLLADGDIEQIKEFLPQIVLALDFLISRIDPDSGLIRVGSAGTLIERAYHGDGKGGDSFPSGTFAAFLKALKNAIELAKMTGENALAAKWSKYLADGQQAFPQLVADGAYLMSSLTPDGVPHGVIGAEKFNYFESNANCDAVAWGVVDGKLGRSILNTIDSLPGLRPTPLIASCWERRDDSRPDAQSDPAYGDGAGYHWNGAAWYSSNARFLLALLAYDRFDDAAALVGRMLEYAASGTLRDVHSNYGKNATGKYNSDPGALYIDAFGIFGAALRGLFEYEFTADKLLLRPHLPENTSCYQQLIPVKFGRQLLKISVNGKGKTVAAASINGVPAVCNDSTIEVPRSEVPGEVIIEIIRK